MKFLSDLRNFYQFFRDLNIETSKTDYSRLLFFSSPLPGWLVSIFYLLFVLHWGPLFMRHRPAYNLTKFIIAYDVAQILINAWLTCFGLALQFYYGIYADLCCGSALPSNHPLKSAEVFFYYVYYVMKFVDYLDTIIFVLRKNFNQISFLHVYHHVAMVLIGFVYARFIGSQLYVLVTLNSLVHCIMYYYYLMAILYPEKKKTFWWKKYITQIQFFQFILLLGNSVYALFIREDCQYPKFILWCSVIQHSFMMIMFANFYRKSYYKNRAYREKQIMNKIE